MSYLFPIYSQLLQVFSWWYFSKNSCCRPIGYELKSDTSKAPKSSCCQSLTNEIISHHGVQNWSNGSVYNATKTALQSLLCSVFFRKEDCFIELHDRLPANLDTSPSQQEELKWQMKCSNVKTKETVHVFGGKSK